jgi:hypothetical protein
MIGYSPDLYPTRKEKELTLIVRQQISFENEEGRHKHNIFWLWKGTTRIDSSL